MWVQVLVHLVNHRTNIAFNTFTVTHSIQTYTELDKQGVPETINIYICTLCPKTTYSKEIAKNTLMWLLLIHTTYKCNYKGRVVVTYVYIYPITKKTYKW